MQEKIPLLDFFRSDKFMLYTALFAVIFLTPNTYYVFYSFCAFISPYKEIASAGVALIIASFIFIYTLRGNYRIATTYSYFEVVISAYYYITTIGWDWGLIPALAFTIILPVSVNACSRELKKIEVVAPIQDNSKIEEVEAKMQEIKKEVDSFQFTYATLEDLKKHNNFQEVITEISTKHERE